MNGLASVFPPPPPYYKKYTQDADFESPELQPPVPPDPSIQQTYRNFGSIWNIEETLPGLEGSGIAQVYKLGPEPGTSEIVSELKRLINAVLLQYVGLLQTLTSDPTQFPGRVEDLRTLFINIHHLVNTYRPLQTKESLVLKIQDQISAARQSADSMRQTNDRISQQITALEAVLPLESAFGPASTEQQDKTWKEFNLDIDVVTTAENEMAIE